MKIEEVTNIEEAAEYLRPRFKGLELYVRNYTEDDFSNFCHSQLSHGS